MGKGINLIGGLGLGAAVMYVLDPALGRRRRSVARDQVVHGIKKAGSAATTLSHDVGNRAQGAVARARSAFRRGEATDEVLRERVRAKIGRYCSHPSAIEVSAADGRISLRGPILAREVDGLVAAVYGIKGVTSVENQMEVHERAENIPGLQGQGVRMGEPMPWMRTNWTPTTRLVTGLAGGALAVWGFRHGGMAGAGLGTLGICAVTRSLTNMEVKRLVGLGAGRRAVVVQKTINFDAPIEKVWEFWDHYPNFPGFMSHVREVRDIGGGRSHWVVDGPGGAPVEWDAEITQRVPNEVLAWKTLPGSIIQHSGIVQFWRNEHGGTTVNIRLSYNPITGAVGHIIASMLGSDPKSRFDQDLVRMKTVIETGQLPRS